MRRHLSAREMVLLILLLVLSLSSGYVRSEERRVGKEC